MYKIIIIIIIIMYNYNRVYNYFVENKFIFPKQFRFQISNSTEHTALEILLNSLKKTYTNNVLYKLKLHRVNGTCLQWFKSYLSNRSKCIVNDVYDNIKKLVYLDIFCGVHHRSILDPLLFLIYVNEKISKSCQVCWRYQFISFRNKCRLPFY